jgi:hypothetical protein
MVASVIGYAGVCLDLRNRDNTHLRLYQANLHVYARAGPVQEEQRSVAGGKTGPP